MLVDHRRSRRVTVLGSFTATVDGETVSFGADAARLVAYLAVHRRAQRPVALAADLWPGTPAAVALPLLEEVAAAPREAGFVTPDGPLVLADGVVVDLAEAMALVRTLTDAAGRPDGVPADLAAATALLRCDVLPGESAAWLAVERERFRQIRLNALEELSGSLGAAGRHAEAVALAEETVRTAPSRESARRALIEAHLAQGDIAEAVAQYDEYQELLRSSVGAPAAFGFEGAFGLDSLLPPVPAWPVLRGRRPAERVPVAGAGMRAVRGPRRLVSGGATPGTTR